jgi:hypothetical protein
MNKIEEIREHLKRPFGLINKYELIDQTKFLLSERKKLEEGVETIIDWILETRCDDICEIVKRLEKVFKEGKVK